MTYLDEIAHQIRDNLSPEATPPEGADLLFVLYALLARTKGESTTSADVHDAWAAWMQTVDATHAAIVPFDELARTVQEEDLPYLQAIHQTAVQLRGNA